MSPGARASSASRGSEASQAEENQANWRVVVDSIGTSGARMVSVLRPIARVPESRLAELLFQAPSVLAEGLTREVAEQADRLLRDAGLETRAVGPDGTIEPGDDRHEIALVVREVSRMPELLAEVVNLLGVDPDRARAILTSSPTVLVGRVSAHTVETCRERFAKLGAEIDVMNVADAVFDVFLGRCSPAERARVRSTLSELGIELPEGEDDVLVAMGLTKEQAERIWERFARTRLPLRLISRDFERFDVTLDSAPDTPAMLEYLVSTTGMPESLAPQVVRETPIVLHEGVGFDRMTECIQAVNECGGKATGHLLAFQTFSLRVTRLGDRERSARVLGVLTDEDEGGALRALEDGTIPGPLTHLQARWLQWELEQAGTETERILR